MGSGGGIPGLALALTWPESRWVLIEAIQRRATFLAQAVATLDLEPRVAVVRERAEVVGRNPDHRGQADLVVARAFGPPAATAECAAPLLRVGGQLVVSEPPEHRPDRWPADGLALLGQRLLQRPEAGPNVVVVRQVEVCGDRYPRRTGVPAKRPLF